MRFICTRLCAPAAGIAPRSIALARQFDKQVKPCKIDGDFVPRALKSIKLVIRMKAHC
jgi:hypothetical protein